MEEISKELHNTRNIMSYIRANIEQNDMYLQSLREHILELDSLIEELENRQDE